MKNLRKTILLISIAVFFAATIVTVKYFNSEGSGVLIFMGLLCIAGLWDNKLNKNDK